VNDSTTGSAAQETPARGESECSIKDNSPAEISTATVVDEPKTSSESGLRDLRPPCFAETNAGTEQTEEPTAWRDELAERLNRYRSRRKPRPPRYPSLCLTFNQPAGISDRPLGEASGQKIGGSFASVIENALALDPYISSDSAIIEAAATSRTDRPTCDEFSLATSNLPGNTGPASHQPNPLAHLPAKILQFPRLTSAAAPISLNELAEPVSSRPRILEVPDVMPPPPALGGIMIEPAPPQAAERLPGIDVPLQSAPLSRRLIAGIIDTIIVATGCALAACIFWKVAALRPPRLQLLALAPVSLGLLWAAYQYLFIVYAGKTPGLTIARLELTGFNGSRVCRRLRRWRVLASYLSALSLGMGYAWVFIDEESLCWHDRITHTYLAPKKQTL
jgi:hypothetical protein